MTLPKKIDSEKEIQIKSKGIDINVFDENSQKAISIYMGNLPPGKMDLWSLSSVDILILIIKNISTKGLTPIDILNKSYDFSYNKNRILDGQHAGILSLLQHTIFKLLDSNFYTTLESYKSENPFNKKKPLLKEMFDINVYTKELNDIIIEVFEVDCLLDSTKEFYLKSFKNLIGHTKDLERFKNNYKIQLIYQVYYLLYELFNNGNENILYHLDDYKSYLNNIESYFSFQKKDIIYGWNDSIYEIDVFEEDRIILPYKSLAVGLINYLKSK